MPAPKTQTTPDGFKLEQFGGMLPAWDDHLIPLGQAARSVNGYLFSGRLQGWREPKLLHTLANPNAKFAYRLPTRSQNIANATIYILGLPIEGDTVTLGEEIYTFRSLPSHAYDVLIGASAAAAATNLFRAFTIDNGNSTNVGVSYGTGTVANPAIDQTEPITTNILALDVPRIEVFAPSSGAAYNTTLVATSAPARAIWRYNNATTATFSGGTNISFDATITGTSTWLEFNDPDTDVMRSPVVDDSYDRFYFACPSIQPEYNTRARLEAGSANWLLGVPAPGCAPGVDVAGGSSAVTLGFETSSSSASYAPGANTAYLIPITPDGAMILNDVTFMPNTTSTTAEYAAVLYEDLNGAPHTLLNAGLVGFGTTAATEVSSAFVNPTGLLRNVKYWVGIMLNEAISLAVGNDTGHSAVVANATFSNGPPPVINAVATGATEAQVWFDLTSSAVLEARSYVYTYLSEYDEESAPSPATIETGWSNGTWTITLFTPPPDQMGVTRNLTQLRIYRSVTAQAGATTYFHVVDLPITTASYEDIITDDVVVTNFELESQLWTPPPVDMQSIISMPNGMAVGFRANEIWFSEPYRPHAWPASYVLTTEYPIVGLGVSGSSVVACTSGSPYIATGTSPGTMSALKVQNSEPCHSRGSIIGTNDGVYYSSPNGLILVTQYGAVTNTSELWITREQWQALAPQKNLRSVFLVSSYFSLGCVRNGDTSQAQSGFTIELNANDAQSFSIWPQPGGHRLGFSQLTGPNGVDVVNLWIDPWSSVGLVLQSGGVYYFDFTDLAPTMQVYTWRSKLFQQPTKKNFEAMRISFTTPDGTPTVNATRLEADTDDPVWVSGLPADRYGFVRLYVGNDSSTLVTAREIRNPNELLRILSGFKKETWQIEIEARVPISGIQIATSVKALSQI